MAQSSRTFRIFVSSTFSDLKEERNALQEEVFPRLRDLAASHGCRFQAIDLRWGVSEEAALDQQTMKICLGEIERCQKTSPKPNFLVLLGDRYGWRPIPSEIPADEFDQIISKLAKDEKPLLEQWYRRDDNALPPVYCLQARSGDNVDYSSWELVENHLRQSLLKAIEKLTLSPNEMLKYTASATEQEIVAGALRVQDAQDHVFCFFREINGLPEGKESKDFHDSDAEASRMQKELKERLKNQLVSNVHEYSAQWQKTNTSLDHLEQLCDDVYSELSKVILAETGKLEKVDALDAEITAHETFGKDRARIFVGRADILSTIEKYITGNDAHPLAVWGASGSGKSALMAKAVEQALKNEQDVLYRFIGATPESSNGRALLASLCQQISRRYGADESTIPAEYKDLVQEFQKRLALAKPDKPLIIFLDALDQLSDTDNARSLIWTPAGLPPNVNLIVSTLPGECLKALESKLPSQNRLEVQPMSVDDGKNILTEWMSGVNRQLRKKQEEYLLDKFQQCGLPLYLKLAFEEARLWKSYDALPELSNDIPGILRDLFTRLSLELNHGGMLVSRSLGYLAAGKNGLSEDELLDVLSLDKEMLADFQRRSPMSPKSDRLPVVIWSRLFFDLEPYLVERSADNTSLMGFYHRQMSDACLTAYRDTARHAELAAYFNSKPLYLEKEEQAPNLRKLSELPWQLAQGCLSDSLADLLSDYRFLSAMITAIDIGALIEDFELVKSTGLAFSDDDLEGLELIQGVLNLDYSLFVKRGIFCLASQLHVRLLDIQNTRIVKLLSQARNDEKEAWLHPLSVCGQVPDQSGERILFTGAGRMEWLGITPDGKRIVACGVRKITPNENNISWTNDLKVWEVSSGKEEISVKLLDQSIGSALGKTIFELTPDGDTLIWNYWDTGNHHKVSLAWLDIRTGYLSKCEFPIAPKYLLATADGKNLIATSVGAYGNKIMLWDLREKKSVRTMIGDAAPVGFIKLIPASTRFIAVSTAGVVNLWDYESGLIEHTYQLEGVVENILVTADGSRLVVNKKQGGIQIVDIYSGQESLLIKDSCENFTDYSPPVFSPDGNYLYCKGQIFNMQGELLQKIDDRSALSEPYCFIKDPFFTPDSKAFIYNTGSGGRINKVDILTGQKDFETGKYFKITATPDFKKWITTTETQISIRNFGAAGINENKKPAVSTTIMDRTILGQNFLAIVKWETNKLCLFLRDLKSAEKQTIPFPLSSSLFPNRYRQDVSGYLMAVCPEDHLALFHYRNIDLVAWDYQRNEAAWISLDENPSANRVLTTWIISPDRRWLVGADHDNGRESASGQLIYIWNFTTGRLEHTLEMFKTAKENATLTISPDSQQLACATDNDIFLVNLSSGKVKRELKGHTRRVLGIRYTPDGTMLISDSWDKTVRIWELNGMESNPLTGFLGNMSMVQQEIAVSPDGKYLAYSTATKEIKIYDLPGKALLYSIASEALFLTISDITDHFVCFTNDGRYLVICSHQGTEVSLWDVAANERVASLYSDNKKMAGIRIICDESIKIVLGNRELLTIVPENIEFGKPIVTALRKKKNIFTKASAIVCPFCDQWAEVPNESAGMEACCPNCSKHVKLNPFTIEGDWEPIA